MSIVQFGLPLMLSTPFILAAWIAFMHQQQSAPEQDSRGEPVDFGLATVLVDLEAALHEALAEVEAVARSRWVRMELAMGMAISVPVNPHVLRTALVEAMLTAIHATQGGQVLVTSAMFGSQLHIRITDDGPGTDRQAREGAMRRTETMVALQGGSIAVETRPGRGTSVTIRLSLPASSAEQEPRGPAQIPALAEQAA